MTTIKLCIQNILTCVLSSCIAFSSGYSQTDSSKRNNYEDLSLKELLSIKIVSASKKSELLFESPLSASVITKEDIQRAGCTSIMEALRLVPGMLVKEQTNGNYDIHLRGMNIPPNVTFEGNSSTTLVMMDNRPIYSYLKGGTLWETLPMDINDVERIEVVRGPAAALYGPNAVNGVINIITRETKKDGLYLVANSRQGSLNTFISNASIGFQSKKWSTIVSGNYQHRDRTQTSYYEHYKDSLLEHPEYLITFLLDTNVTHSLYPVPELAMEKYAGNVFFNYKPSEKIKLNLAAGIQHSMVQRVSTENLSTPLSTSLSDTRYIDLRANVKSLSAQLSYNEGTQSVELYPGNKYDFNTFDANVEYSYTRSNFSLKPGLSYRSAIYDDTKYSDFLARTGIFNVRGQIITRSASLRSEHKLLDNRLRLVAALSVNKFNYPDTTYLSYQFAATYKLNTEHLFRAVFSRSPRSATIADTYVDQSLVTFSTGDKKFTEVVVEGNKNIKLLIADMFEIGYRGSITPRKHIDVDRCGIRTENYSSLISNREYTIIRDTDTIDINPLIATNLPLIMFQKGITVSVVYTSGKLQIKPFVTLQKSKAKHYAPFMSTPDAGLGMLQNDDPARNNIYSRMGSEQVLKATPAVFGGTSINYEAGSKFNVNLTAYYNTAQTYDHMTNLIFYDGIRGIDHIRAKLIINANISYEATKGLHVFISGKNLLNDTSREFFQTDKVSRMLLAGINYEF